MSRPIIALTMGDAAGIGPEIVMKALGHAELFESCRPLVIGDAGRLRQVAPLTGSALVVRPVDGPADALFQPGTLDCVDLGLIPSGLPFGEISAVCGHAAYSYIARAVELAKAGSIDAICTAPLNKEALHAGGHLYPGHTEMLADLTGTPEVSMMLVAPKLRVIHVTTHIGLIDAVAKIEPGLVERTILRGHDALVRAGIAAPRIGVCGINPHAGEHGLFGHGEEEAKIVPAVLAARARGCTVEGPLPADSLFFRASRGDFDLVVAMYHGQGHIPMKLLDFERTVNVTVGIPIVRTSVDHGTAFDIAGRNCADATNMMAAMRMGARMAAGKLKMRGWSTPGRSER